MKIKLQSENVELEKLPKLLGNRADTPDKAFSKFGANYSTHQAEETSLLNEAKLLNKIARNYIRENTIESLDEGDSKIIHKADIEDNSNIKK